ncbi:MAG: hypothetical protein ACP5JW_06195 [Candidatus Bathyarchaeia archaeon]
MESAIIGMEAAEKAEAKLFNIALIDIMLPDTTIQHYKNAVEALNKGADAYIMKPLNIEEASAYTTPWAENRYL